MLNIVVPLVFKKAALQPTAEQSGRPWAFLPEEEKFILDTATIYGGLHKKSESKNSETIEIFMTSKKKVFSEPDFVFVKEARTTGSGYVLRIMGEADAVIDSVSFAGITRCFKGYMRNEYGEKLQSHGLRLV